MGKGREIRRTRGEGELDPGRQLENRSEGVTRRVSLVCSCWRLSNCLLALTKESYNEAMFDSEPFFFGGLSLPIQTTLPSGLSKTFPVSFLKHLSNEQFCSSQMLSEWPLKAQLNLGKVTLSRKTGMRIGISRRVQGRWRSFSRQRSRCGPRLTQEIWQRWAWTGSGLPLSRWIHPQTPVDAPNYG